jgi:hypothetical protein
MELEAWLYTAAKAWNERNRKRDEITEHDVATCDGCSKALSEPAHEQQALFGGRTCESSDTSSD